MKGAVALLTGLWSFVEALARAAIVALTAAMVVATFAQVVARYGFAAPLSWSEELSRFLFVWLSFLAAWLAWNRREHIVVDVLPETLRPAASRLCEALVLGFAVLAMAQGMRLMGLASRQPSAALNLPMVWVYAGFYAGFVLIAADIVLGWLRAIAGRGESQP